MLVEISGVCPSCCVCVHHGDQRGESISYLCTTCYTSFVRRRDSLVCRSEPGRSGTLEGLKQIEKILKAARQELREGLGDD